MSEGVLFKSSLFLLSLLQDAVLHRKYKQVRNAVPSDTFLTRDVKDKNRSKNCINQVAANGYRNFLILLFDLYIGLILTVIPLVVV